jgi:hypothetical protein
VTEWLPSPIYASEALLAYVILGDGLAEELRAIRPQHRSKLAKPTSARPLPNRHFMQFAIINSGLTLFQRLMSTA